MCDSHQIEEDPAEEDAVSNRPACCTFRTALTIGGPRIRKLCAEMILEVVTKHIRPSETVRHGQVLWTAVSRDDPPAWRRRIAEMDLVR